MQRNRRSYLLLALIVFVGSCVLSARQSAYAAYTAPGFAENVFHSDKAQGKNGGLIDVSTANEGYVGVTIRSSKQIKFQVTFGQANYNYDVKADGTASYFPLQSGNGSYRFRLLENVSDNRYRELCSVSADVVLQDEFQPYLHSSTYVPYTKDSNCVKKAAELAKNANDALGVVTAVFDYVRTNITYDYEKARTVKAGYLPNPDELLKSGKGICFDFSALTAAMLRSQGIPTKMIFGYVAPDNIYHAWNMFYTKETGWVTVGYQVSKSSWNRLDITFSAGGKEISEIINSKNYSDVYCY